MRLAQFGCILLLTATAGCSREASGLVQVTGSVKVNGQPADGVNVNFWPTDANNASRNRYGSATTGQDGRFELKSFSEKGIEPGEYKVTFSRLMANGKPVTDPKKHPNGRELLQDKYTTQDTTDVTARVTKDDRDFVFEVLSKPK